MDKQEKAWGKAERSIHAERIRLMESTRKEVFTLLKKARDDIVLVLAGTPSDYQAWHLSELQKEIDRILSALRQNSSRVASEAINQAWAGGIAAIDTPLSAIGIQASFPHLDVSQLMAMRVFMVDRINDISVVAAGRIRSEIGLASIGSQSINDTIARVSVILGEGSKARATTIVRTELSRAWAWASHERALQSAGIGVEMDKVWRRSGKVLSRISHDMADGQRVPVEKKFTIGGVKMRFPHDPKAPAAEVINCGCIALYRPRHMKATLPDARPFTAEEINANPIKADMAAYRFNAAALPDSRIQRLKGPAATAPTDEVAINFRGTLDEVLTHDGLKKL